MVSSPPYYLGVIGFNFFPPGGKSKLGVNKNYLGSISYEAIWDTHTHGFLKISACDRQLLYEDGSVFIPSLDLDSILFDNNGTTT